VVFFLSLGRLWHRGCRCFWRANFNRFTDDAAHALAGEHRSVFEAEPATEWFGP